MQQQLQQAGVLQQLAVVMVALNTDMREQTEFIRGWGVDELCSHLTCYSATKGSVAQLALVRVAGVYHYLRLLWSSPNRTRTANSPAWLCDPIGHAEAAMQLCTTALQHVSSVLQHAVPALQQRGDEKAALLLLEQQARVAVVTELGCSVMTDIYIYHAVVTGPNSMQEQSSPTATDAQVQQQHQQQVQLLLLSPHCLPCIASLLVLYVSWANSFCSLQTTCSTQGQGSIRAGSSRDSEGPRSSSSSRMSSISRQQGQQQQGAAAGDGPSSSSSSSNSRSTTCSEPPTPCQLQLLQLLGVSPHLTTSTEQQPSLGQVIDRLAVVLCVCGMYHIAVTDLFSSSPEQQGGVKRGLQGDQQRWQFEQQLWLLLPAVMLPCASNILLLPAAGTPRDPSLHPVEVATCAAKLLQQSNQAVFASSRLHMWLGQPSFGPSPPHPAWMGEVVGGVLQLAEQLQQQQQPELQGQGAAAPAAPASIQRGGSTPAAPATPTNISTRHVWQTGALANCARYWSELLVKLLLESSATASPLLPVLLATSSDSTAADVAGVVAPSVSPLAAKFVEVCTAVETGMRVVTTAVQSDMISKSCSLITSGLLCLFLINSRGGRGPLGKQMGMCGTATLASEQRHLYSLVSSLQKLSRCRAGVVHELCWGQQAANQCCSAAAVAAVGLLQSALPVAATGAAAATPPAAGEQSWAASAAAAQLQPEVEYLPSLVIFGRCCLVWAEQLRQQTPDLLMLLAFGAAPQQQQQATVQGAVLAEHSAASICIPGLQPAESCGLQQSMATVSSWMGGLTSPEAHAALAAAAGGDMQHLRQQLQALSAAQTAVLQQGVHDASLAALVEQLQVTGVMLSSVAVPDFCNNPACVNISGHTEVQLVSGRSCICAGCHTARYCGRVCQRQAWPRHKAVCKALAAGAAGAQQ